MGECSNQGSGIANRSKGKEGQKSSKAKAFGETSDHFQFQPPPTRALKGYRRSKTNLLIKWIKEPYTGSRILGLFALTTESD